MGPPCLFWPAQTQIHGWAEKKFSAEFAEKGRTGRGEESGHFEEAKGWAQRRDARRLCAAGATGRGIKGHGQRPGDGQQRDASFESKVWRQGQAHRRIVIPRFGADRGRKIRWGCCCLCRHCRKKCPAARTFLFPRARPPGAGDPARPPVYFFAGAEPCFAMIWSLIFSYVAPGTIFFCTS